jgi:hypothetical protein
MYSFAGSNRARGLDSFDVRCTRRARELADAGRADALDEFGGPTDGPAGNPHEGAEHDGPDSFERALP